MKKIIVLPISICLNLLTAYSQIVSFNHVGWYGEITGHPKFNNDSIVVGLDIEKNSKEIYIPPCSA